MEIAPQVQQSVQDLQSEIKGNRSKALEAKEQQAENQMKLDALEATMNIREKYLAGWFGGDKDGVAQRRNLAEMVEALDTQSSEFTKLANLRDGQIVKTLDEYLRRNDGTYQKLVVPKDAAERLKLAVDEFKGLIEHALSEIDSAQSMETMDMFTKNKGISLMSYAANSDASSAIGDVKRAAPDFQAAVEGYTEAIKGFDAKAVRADIGDGMDLFFDFAFDGFDFMSMFTLSALGSAESDMEGLRGQVQEIDDHVSKNMQDAEAATAAYIKRARTFCLS